MEAQESKGGGALGLLMATAAAVFATVTLLWQKVTKDGHLAAAFRQGVGELGEALKPFPESSQVHEPGTIWNPTQGEIASDRKNSNYGNFQTTRLPSPSEIARDSRGSVYGDDRGQANAPQPERGDDGHGR